MWLPTEEQQMKLIDYILIAIIVMIFYRIALRYLRQRKVRRECSNDCNVCPGCAIVHKQLIDDLNKLRTSK